MTMRHLEHELLNSGNPDDILRAQVIAKILRERGDDVPLPSTNDTAITINNSEPVGRMALYDPADHMLEVTDEMTERRALNLEALHDKITSITNPITQHGIFNKYLPEPGKAPRTLLPGGRKVKWGFDIKDGDIRQCYNFDMKYKEVEGSKYRATEVTMNYYPSNDLILAMKSVAYERPYIKIGLIAGKPEWFERGARYKKGFDSKLLPSAIASQEKYSLGAIPSVTITGRYDLDRSKFGGIVSKLTYFFNPDTNQFEVPAKRIEEAEIDSGIANMSVDVFCAGLSDSMKLLPIEST